MLGKCVPGHPWQSLFCTFCFLVGIRSQRGRDAIAAVEGSTNGGKQGDTVCEKLPFSITVGAKKYLVSKGA